MSDDRADGVPTIHPLAIVDDGAQIGAGTHVWHFSHVRVRAAALEVAYARHPECFVRRAPRPPALPAVVSINPAVEEAEAASGVNFPTLPKTRERLDG